MGVTCAIEEYTEQYCLSLELAYGQGMMSEGREEGIRHMFEGIDLVGKSILDIGFGLGGIALYLASHFDCDVKGVEINPWLVEEATRRVPIHLKDKLVYKLYRSDHVLPFEDIDFDIVYSKGALCHVQDKQYLLDEIMRVLRPKGQLLITDWLSPSLGQWGSDIKKLMELDDLTLFAETEASYQMQLLHAGFKDIVIRDENPFYAQWNRDVVKRLQTSEIKRRYLEQYDAEALSEAIRGYELIANSMENQSLLVRQISANKSA